MTSIALYDDTLHRNHVIALWKDVFGYDTPHNEPGLVIDRKVAVRDDLFFVALADQTLVGKTLVSHAECALIDRSCLKINLQIIADNERVVAFYRMLGYDVEPRVSIGKRIR